LQIVSVPNCSKLTPLPVSGAKATAPGFSFGWIPNNRNLRDVEYLYVQRHQWQHRSQLADNRVQLQTGFFFCNDDDLADLLLTGPFVLTLTLDGARIIENQ